MILIFTTIASKVVAYKLGRKLLELRLIACYNLTEVESSYWWEGEIKMGSEALMILKTKEENFEKIFSQHDNPEDMPEVVLPAVTEGIWLPKLLVEAQLVSGTGEARRLIQQNAVSLNGDKVSDIEYLVATQGEIILKVGKRRFCKVRFT